ncbi:uncharacterized protein CHSO_3250 [Chryseobacterium sp. StRB126]|uniref:hypothetical protein n=1 Tax=Chryseobacterium sp. StRB126 TaxID=878220 RepID=UPI0004E99653|nr:hypothetical protein [Chryseobacterium sp. StRB126]BAP32287.1 uncharacterized protein CHSO_3250 [Chryseobacterium sp. StRB126]
MIYEIYKKNEISTEIWEPNPKDFNPFENASIEIGKIDLNNLQNSKFNPILSEIPKSNMEELKTMGETSFTIITKQTVIIRNKKED